MSLFVLLHGAWHGGWCWRAVQEELSGAGHDSVAPDLPCDDVDAGWREYASSAISAIASDGQELIVVGHSLAGGVLPIIATDRPVKRLVLVCSAPPEPRQSLDDSLAGLSDLTDPRALTFRETVDSAGRYVWPGLDAATFAMYADCDAETARWAYANLRAQATKPFTDPLPVDRWPDVPLTFIACAEDRMGRAGPLGNLCRQRFGLDPVVLPGGHSPFLSRPAQLTRALLMEP